VQGFQLGPPQQDGPSACHNDGNRLGRIFDRVDPVIPSCYYNDINLETHKLGCEFRDAMAFPLRISVLGGDVLSFDVAKRAQSQPDCLSTGGLISSVGRR
jgi:hypothetical protein